MSEPRFYVREHSGYLGGLKGKLHTEVMVIDRDYCHSVVRAFNKTRDYQQKFMWVDGRYGGTYIPSLPARRAAAASLCDRLNLDAVPHE